MKGRRRRVLRTAITASIAAGTLLSGCTAGGTGSSGDDTALPKTGVCHRVEKVDAEAVTAPEVSCSSEHDAQTYYAGALAAALAETSYRSRAAEAAAATTCGAVFPDHLGTDLSTAMRSLVTWRVFWPSRKAWSDGARWFGCDVIGGPRAPLSQDLAALPEDTEGLLADDRARERWLACVDGPSVSEGSKVPCTRAHDWRAVTTIKLGEPTADYLGDTEVVARTEDFCASSVKAWLGYPDDFEFGYTWFGKGAWEGGNRRSVCWAKTNR